MRLATQELVPVSILNAKRRFAALLLATLVFTFGAGACGVQEEVEKAQQAQKQLEKKQQELEEKLQERQ